MGGDLVYSRDAISPLLETVNDLLADGGIFLMLYVDRFIANLAKVMEEKSKSDPYNFVCEEILLDGKIDDTDSYVYIFKKQ